ncbi:MAG: Hsp70 family protein [Synergistaceae bacterium]|jgi:actin-like ATPase involved in cell morphogenesis|nr:Hsp70 family protein [Synergistaceae bacterium]
MDRMKTFLGIDFGTTQTSVARVGEKTKYEPEIVEIDGKKSVYTALRLNAAGNVDLFGDEALDRIHEAPEDTFYNFKADLGSGKTYHSSCGREYSPEELTYFFLRYLAQKIAKKYFNAPSLEKVEDLSCTIGCPAAWDENLRNTIADIARKAEFPNVACCAEPVGVVYYCYDRGDLSLTDPQNILVYDFGGGTTDVAVEEVSPDEDGVIRKIPTILSVSERSELGDLGGRNFDKALRDHFIEQMGTAEVTFGPKDLKMLELYSKRLKEKLSIAVDDGKNSEERETFFLLSKSNNHTITLSKNEFEQVCEPLINRLKEPIDSALNRQLSLNVDGIGYVILAGGSSRLYYVKIGIKDLFPNSEIVVSANPVEVVAKGLALYGRFSVLGPNTVPARPESAQDGDAKAAGLETLLEERADLRNRSNRDSRTRWKKLWLPLAAVVVIAILLAGYWYLEKGSAPTIVQEPVEAVAQDDAQAEYEMGLKHEAAQDYRQAFESYKKAADKGLADAQNKLGEMYYYGLGVKKNDDISAAWFYRAIKQYIKTAKSGDTVAEALLRKMGEEVGAMYEKSDHKTAYMWYYIASSYGSTPAKDKLDALRGKGWLNGAGWWTTVTFSWLSKADAESAEHEARLIMNTQ